MLGRPQRLALSCTALAATLTVAGCSSGGDSGPHAQQSAPPQVHAQGLNPTPLADIKQGGTLTSSIQQWIDQYNPYEVDGFNGDGATIMQVVEPYLWLVDGQGVSHPNTDFLLDAKVTSTSPQVVTYDLNPKAKWSTGKPLGYQDFKALWKALNGTDPAFDVADTSGYSQISDVSQGDNPHQVKVTFAKPYADWQKLFKTLMPADGISTPAQFNTGWVEKIPITGSAFKLGGLNRTTQTITEVQDPTWWGTKPKLDKIIWRAMDPSADVGAYLSHEIDYTSAASPEQYKQVKGDPDTQIQTGARWDEVHITLNGASGPLSDVRVRQAFGEAINRQVIAKAIGNGLPFAPPLLGNHFYMVNQKGYQDNAGQYGTYDPVAAKKLLDAAGWKDNGPGKARTRNGQPLTLDFVLNGGSTSPTFDMADLVTSMEAQVGIVVKQQKVPENDWADQYVNRGKFDLTTFRNVDEVFPSMLYPVFQQTTPAQIYQNYGRIGSAQIDALMNQAATTTDPARSTALYNQVDKLLWQEGHSLELYQRPQIIATRKGLANCCASGLGDVDYTKVGWVKGS